jgi:hypothetical protein
MWNTGQGGKVVANDDDCGIDIRRALMRGVATIAIVSGYIPSRYSACHPFIFQGRREGFSMPSNNHWYPRYVGDYMSKTQDLSLMEHGAYTVLMDYYYSTNQPLPANAQQLHRICRAFAKDEQDALQSVLDKFFFIYGNF